MQEAQAAKEVHATPDVQPLGVKIRLVQVYYAIVLLVGLLYGAFINPEGDLGFVYDLSMIRAIVQMWTSAQAIWMLQKRFRITVPFCIVSTIACAVLSAIDVFGMGANILAYNLMGRFTTVTFVVIEYVLAAVVIGYLALSRSAKRILVVEMDMEPEGPGNSWHVLPYRKRIRTWVFWRDTIMYFIVFSFLGHWAEILFCRLIIAGVFMGDYDPSNAMLWDQWLFPFPAEGTAAVLADLALVPVKEAVSGAIGKRVAA